MPSRGVPFLSGYKLVNLKGINLIKINLGGRYINKKDNRYKVGNSYMDVYGARRKDDVYDAMLTLDEYIKKYKLQRNGIALRPKNGYPIVIRYKPKYNANPEKDFYYLHCQQMLLRYKVWYDKPENAWNDDESPENIIKIFHKYIETPEGQKNIPERYKEEFESYKALLDEIFDEYSEDEDTDDNLNFNEEWMKISKNFGTVDAKDYEDDISLQTDENNDWTQDIHLFREEDVQCLQSWLKELKDYEPPVTKEYVNWQKYNVKQSKCIKFVKEKYDNNETYHLILTGGPGTGKSEVIKGIKAIYQPHELLVTATTGVAAANINATTIHSELRLPVKSLRNHPLDKDAAKKLQAKLKGVKCIIVDEFSFMGQKTLAWLHKRCVTATGSAYDVAFGNISIILVGDIWQLPPVAAKALWKQPSLIKPPHALCIEGYVLYKHTFKACVYLTKNERIQEGMTDKAKKKAEDFATVLEKLKTGDVEFEDYNKLFVPYFKGNHPQGKQDNFKNCIRLFATNVKRRSYNNKKLKELRTPVARIKAEHSPKTKGRKLEKIESEEFMGLESELILRVGSRVMYKINTCTKAGLANSSMGTVVAICYKTGVPPALPDFIVVDFDDYSGPRWCENQNDGIDRRKWVPVVPVTRLHDSIKTYARRQLPITVSFGITIHKSQSLTLEKSILDIGTKAVRGLSYVAYSRHRNLKDSLVEPFPYSRLLKEASLKGFADLKAEDARLKKLTL